jgi:hypothetical protein
MLIPFVLSLTLSAAQPNPGYLPWPAEAGPTPAAVVPAGRASATLRLEVIDDDLPSFPLPVPIPRAAGSPTGNELPSFEIPVRRSALPE